MKYLILSVFLLVILPITAITAQTVTNKEVYCDDAKKVISSLVTGEYQEKLAWMGDSESGDSKFVLLMNTKTKTWTLIQMNQEVACVLGSGEKGTAVIPNTAKQIRSKIIM